MALGELHPPAVDADVVRARRRLSCRARDGDRSRSRVLEHQPLGRAARRDAGLRQDLLPVDPLITFNHESHENTREKKGLSSSLLRDFVVAFSLSLEPSPPGSRQRHHIRHVNRPIRLRVRDQPAQQQPHWRAAPQVVRQILRFDRRDDVVVEPVQEKNRRRRFRRFRRRQRRRAPYAPIYGSSRAPRCTTSRSLT